MPRPPISKKRKAGGEEKVGIIVKKAKIVGSPCDLALVSHFNNDTDAVNPASFAKLTAPVAVMAGHHPQIEISKQGIPVPQDAANELYHALQHDIIEEQTAQAQLNLQEEGNNPIVSVEPAVVLPELDSPEDEVHLLPTSPPSEVRFGADLSSVMDPEPGNIFSSQSAAVSSLVSPPESAHTDAEATPPASTAKRIYVKSKKDDDESREKLTPPLTSSSRQSSRRQSKQVQRYTPESGNGGVGRESTPPLVGGVDVSKVRVGSEIEADEDSLKLIRELQAEDRGLRRRGRV